MRKSHSVYDVFTPTTQAQLNFVPRPSVNDQLVDALRTPGKQLIVYGESGSGKSTLLLNKLREVYPGDGTNPGHITTQCSSATTYDSLILDAFDQLGPYYVSGRGSQKSKGVSPSLAAEFHVIKAKVDANLTKTKSQTETRMLPPQLTVQRLAQFLGAQDMCWVIEDFHKMTASEKVPFSQSLKVFCDISARFPHVKTISIGATETARQVVEYDPEMRNRVSELLVPLMTDEELTQILARGQGLLNIDLSRLIVPIAQYSVGVPSVCHQLALNVCLERGINSTSTSKTKVTLTVEDLKPAVERYVRESSDTLKAAFDKALRRHKVKRFDNCRLILQALAQGPLEGMLHADILASIRRVSKDYPASNLTIYLQQLIGRDRGSILRAGIDGRYRFAEPLYHTFAQLTLTEKTPSQGDWESAIPWLVRGSITHLIVSDPDLDSWVKHGDLDPVRIFQIKAPQKG